MGLRYALSGSVAALVFGASGVFAQDVAVLIGNETYRNFNSVPTARSVLTTSQAFDAAGYEVIRVADGTEAQIKNALDRFETLHGDADRVVVVLAGQFMNAQSVTWFAPSDLQSPSLSNVGFDAFPLSTVLSFLALKPGGAALFLANQDDGVAIDAPIQKGVGDLDIPQGVLVAQGGPTAVRKALSDAFLVQDVSLAEAVDASSDLKVSGFVSDLVSLNGYEGSSEDQGVAVDLNVTAALAEQAFWQAVESIGSKASYEAYLRKYPSGEFAEQANEMLQVIADTMPKYTSEEQAERNMALTRNDRRRV